MNAERWNEVEAIFANALELQPEDRDTYLAHCTSEIRDEVRSLLAAHRSAADFLEQPPAIPEAEVTDPLIDAHVGAYRIVRRIADGGMGTVYLGQRSDGEFNLQVAVKLVQRGLDTEILLRRFRQERQILAALQHPNIARLLDGGVTDNGAPYIVMEYIDGTPVVDYCRTRGLSIRRRMELFRDICAVVHYAHQHLVVHRDIKPANILITADGTPKLLDFGIARLVTPADEADGSPTLTAFNPLTPDYASPEQLRGKPPTTATDIYSLGVLLYELLTYAKPFALKGATPSQVEQIVCNTEPSKPSARVADASGVDRIAGDLDHIVLKAMRKEPAGRYSSAEALAADVDNFLASRPVEARRGSRLYVARKFVRRHRASVAVAAAGLLFVTAAVIAVVREAADAREQRARAEVHFDETRRLATSLIFDVHDRIAKLAGATPVRKLIVQKAARYLDALGEDAAGNSDLQVELASAYVRLASVEYNWGGASLGDAAGAASSLAKAKRTLEAVLIRQPGRPDARHALALSYLGMSDVHASRHEIGSAIDAARKAESIERAIYRERSSDEATAAYARALYKVGSAVSLRDPVSPEVERTHTTALELYERLLARHPNNAQRQYDAALLHKSLGAYEEEAGRHEVALPHYVKALALDEARSAADPDNAKARLDVSFDLSEIGSNHWARGERTAALADFERALAIRKALAAADPQDIYLRGRVVYMDLQTGRLQWEMDRLDEAATLFSDAVEVTKSNLTRNPDEQDERAKLVDAYLGLALVEQKRDRASPARPSEPACRYYSLAQDELRRGGAAVITGASFANDPKSAAQEFARCASRAATDHLASTARTRP